MSGQNLLPLQCQDFRSLSKGNQVSLVRIHFSHPESDGKSADVGVGGRIGILKKGGSKTAHFSTQTGERHRGVQISVLSEGGVAKHHFRCPPSTDYFFRFGAFWGKNLQFDMHPPGGKVRFAPPLAFSGHNLEFMSSFLPLLKSEKSEKGFLQGLLAAALQVRKRLENQEPERKYPH